MGNFSGLFGVRADAGVRADVGDAGVRADVGDAGVRADVGAHPVCILFALLTSALLTSTFWIHFLDSL